MYWPQPRQRKIGLIHQTLHIFWMAAVGTAAKNLGTSRGFELWSLSEWGPLRSKERCLGLDPSDPITSQKTCSAFKDCRPWMVNGAFDSDHSGKSSTATCMKRLTNAIGQPSRWRPSAIFWTWREISSAIRCSSSSEELLWAVVCGADGAMSILRCDEVEIVDWSPGEFQQ